MQTPVGVEKALLGIDGLRVNKAARKSFLRGRELSCCLGRWLGLLVEEADQSFDVLGGRCQEELLANELHSTQAQATQSDLILQFREQRFHLFSFPWCVRQPGVFAKSLARCRAGSCMWMARYFNGEVVHC